MAEVVAKALQGVSRKEVAIVWRRNAGRSTGSTHAGSAEADVYSECAFQQRGLQRPVERLQQAFQQRKRDELQLYVNRQKQLASSQATAPLQQQIGDLNKLIADQQGQVKKLQEQMQAESTTALQAKSAAHLQGLQQGSGTAWGLPCSCSVWSSVSD
jgi:hypothetical protein